MNPPKQPGLPRLSGLKEGIRFFIFNLATPCIFYITFQIWGPKAAIGFAFLATTIQLLAHWIFRRRLPLIFIIASIFTLSFGGIDLFIKKPQFYRLEPFAQNFIVALMLAISAWLKMPVAFDVLHTLPIPKSLSPPQLERNDPYLMRLTWLWVLYLSLKAGFFLYLALKVDLATLIIARSILGGSSLVLMVLGDIGYRKFVRRS